MSLFSISFVLFVAVGLLLYYVLPSRIQWLVLLALSLFFYFFGGVKTAGYLLFVTLSTYGAARLLGNCNASLKGLTREEKAQRNPAVRRRKRLISAAVLLCNFLLLFFVKYWDFTADGINSIPGIQLPEINLLVPLGISYYMFQSIGYVIDVYRGKYSPEKNVLKYALFVSFFPQITQGPIGRYDDLAPQLYARRDFHFDDIRAGLQLILWGCMKKLVVADRAGVVVDEIYGNYENYGGALIAFGVLFYSIQLYCDFSGGIDIIRGVARLFGIHLAENFRRPIFSTSLTDFWRRWHISLGTWMKDYLFYPLSLSKPFLKLGKFSRKKIGGRFGKILPTSIATFIIYFVIGIWHGSSWKYVAFGFYNGILITSGLLLEPFFARLREKLGLSEEHRGRKAFAMVRTCLLVFIGRYITRAGSFLTSVAMLWKTVRHPIPSQLFNGALSALGLTPWDFLIVGVGVIVLLTVEFFQERGRPLSEALEKKPFVLQWLVFTVGLAVLLFFGIFRGDYITADLIYQQF